MYAWTELFSLCWILLGSWKIWHLWLHSVCVRSSVSLLVFWIMLILLTNFKSIWYGRGLKSFLCILKKISGQDKTELQIPAVQEVALWTQLQTIRQQRINPAAAGARLGLTLGNPKRKGSYRRFKGIKSFNQTLLNEVIQTSDTKLQDSRLPLLRKGFVSDIPVFNPICALTSCVSSFSADVRKTYCYIVWWTGME